MRPRFAPAPRVAPRHLPFGPAPEGLAPGPASLAAAALAFAGTAAVDAPEPEPEAPLDDLLGTAAEAGDLSALLAAVQAAGLVPRLSSEGPFTLFAPTDRAFAAIPKAERDRLTSPEGRDDLVALICAHVAPGRIRGEDLCAADRTAPTLAGPPIRASGDPDVPRIDRADLLATDIQATNGVIHIIDRVLAPQG